MAPEKTFSTIFLAANPAATAKNPVAAGLQRGQPDAQEVQRELEAYDPDNQLSDDPIDPR